MVKRIILAALFAVAAYAQTYGLAPAFPQQFLDNNGNPLASGFVLTCIAGGSCAYPSPAAPQTSYTDSSGFTANPSAVPLDASGRANIWLNNSLLYKLVLVSSTGVVIKTVDNVSAAPGSGGSSTNYWSLSGTSISNNNGSGAGDVSLGGGLTVANDAQLNGNLKLRDADGTPNYALIRAANNMSADVTWRWPATDAAGCLNSNGTGTLSFLPCGGGGGGGSPGGANSDIQFNSSSSFGGSGNLTWDNSNQRVVLIGVTATPGIVAISSWIQADQGFLAVNNASPGTALAYNIIQAPTGGVYANSLRAIKYVQVGSNSGTPTVTTSDTFVTGALYFDTGTHTLKVFNDSSAWVSLATGGATSPGGADTNVQYNTSGSFGGSSNMTFTAQRLTVIGSSAALPAMYAATGYVQSDAGFVASPGTATRYNVIQAPGGGMAANSFTATTYIQSGTSPGPFSSTPPTPTSTDTFHPGALSWDVASGTLDVWNGSTWSALGSGGGGGSPGSPTTSIQYNNGGSFAGSANLTWNNGARAMLIQGTGSTAGLVVTSAYVQADVGFLAAVNGSPGTALQYNAIQVPTGGVYGKSFRAINYSQTGNSSGIPAVTSGDTFVAGAAYFDTSLGVERVYNGSAWTSLAVGGISSLNSLTGALTIAGTTNQITVTPAGTTITLSTPQAIATSSSVNFATLTTTGTISSTAAGAAVAFSGAGSFSVNGTGVMNVASLQVLGGSGNGVNVLGNSASNSIQTIGGINLCTSGGCAGGSALSIVGSTVITSAGVGSFTALGVSGNVIATGTVIGATAVSSGSYIASGLTGVTSTTCSQFTNGICTSP